MKGFYIEVTNNLLEPKHRKAMGTAVWEFMWCLDKITKIDEIGIGWVLGGKPINLKSIAEDIGITEPKISKNLNKLKNAGYIGIKRTPYGMIISINKAKKRFAQKVKSNLTKRENLNVLKGKSNIRQDSIDKTVRQREEKRISPSEEMRLFIKESGYFDKIASELIRKSKAPPDMIAKELLHFRSYWSELNGSGKKQRWELQKTFELKRRLGTWFRNTEKFNQNKQKKIII